MSLQLKIPPIIVAIVIAVLMYLTSVYLSDFSFNLPYDALLFLVFFILGAFFAILGVVSFKKHGTTVNPINTENVSTLVKSGVYKYTRNPMYVGMLMALLGYFSLLGNPLNLLFIALFILYMNKYQIKPEEAFLMSIFGEEYVIYKANVRRWL